MLGRLHEMIEMLMKGRYSKNEDCNVLFLFGRDATDIIRIIGLFLIKFARTDAVFEVRC